MNMNIECPFDHEHGKDTLPLPCQGGAVSLRKVVPWIVERLEVITIVLADRIADEALTLNLQPDNFILHPDEEE